MAETSPIVLTIGHSTLTLETFIHLLKAYSVTKVVDVRTVPRSRHNPQFNRETLPDSLSAIGISYVPMPGLGGLRHPSSNSPNLGWRSLSFRGFADYMQTSEFEDNLQKLTDLTRQERTALMCAEAVPWRCHRSLIADALVVHCIQVEHILSLTHSQLHKITPWAKVEGARLTYPSSQRDEKS